MRILHRCLRDRAAAVALLFALCLFPLIMLTGSAIDLGFITQSKARLNAAADSAALAAAKSAADAYTAGLPNYIALGTAAGSQWFNNQGADVMNTARPAATVAVTQSGFTFVSNVTYQATVSTDFAWIFGFANVPIGGLSSATITANSHTEIVMLLDNSGSMAIAATTAGIVTMEQASMCSTLPASATQGMAAYSWIYTGGYGYLSGNRPPPVGSTNGACDARFTGPANTCFYPPRTGIVNAQGQCTNGGGGSGAFGPHTPQAPCAFACHTAASNDSYALARSLGVQLRIDVVQQAAANVITTLQSLQGTPNLFSVGVYTFRADYTPVYPTTGTAEAGTDLATALQSVQAMTVPVVVNGGDTDFTTAANHLVARVQPAGHGTSGASPLKNLFIVTDGMQDTTARFMGAMTSAANEQTCRQFKTKGFDVFVLYTPYLPLPNPFYLDNDRSFAEAPTGGTSPILAALQACASSAANFFQASDPTAINAAMQQMLKAALGNGGRFTN